MSKRPIGIDLFAGAGGMSLGFEQAGFDIVAAVEIDPIHAAVHHFNFPETKIVARSVHNLSGREIRNISGIGSRAVDVVFGGPPCQGFSLIGQRMLEDPRNQLVKEFVRLVSELNANAFVFENVKGLTVGKHRSFLSSLIDEFSACGYNVRVPWQVLNARNYNVPQDRQRLFLLGSKKGLAIPDYPKAITGEGGWFNGHNSLLPTPSCYDALHDLPDAEEIDELITSDAILTDKWGEPSLYAKELRCLTSNAWHYGYRRKWQKRLLTSSLRTEHTALSKKRFGSTNVGTIEPISRFFKLDQYGVCNTLRAGTDAARGAFTSPRPIHYRYPRCITVREMARLHGYPDWFRFHKTKWHGARQIGNSVPPPLARAVALSIIHALGLPPRKPERIIRLGDPQLLELDMSEASAFWGIPVPIGRRDRKNGQRKQNSRCRR